MKFVLKRLFEKVFIATSDSKEPPLFTSYFFINANDFKTLYSSKRFPEHLEVELICIENLPIQK